MKLSKNVGQQRGFTTACVLISLVFFGLSAFIALRLGGPYMEYRILVGAMDSVVKHDDIALANSRRIVGRIEGSVSRNSGVSPSTLDLRKIVYVVVRDGKKVVGVNYEVSTEIIANLSALMHFQYEATAE